MRQRRQVIERGNPNLDRQLSSTFFVKCDRTTMTQDDLDTGRLVCLVGIAPIQAAEFVIFRISQKMADAD